VRIINKRGDYLSELQINDEKCVLCRACISACPFGALEVVDKKLVVEDNCSLCGVCLNTCQFNALCIEKQENGLLDKNKWSDILVFVEHNEGKIQPVTYELIGKALKLIEGTSYKVYCLIVGYKITELAKELSYYNVEKNFIYDHKAFKNYREDIFCNVFQDCINVLMPAIVLIGGTDVGKSIAPAVATSFHSGLTADCTELILNEKLELVQIRPAFGGNVMAQIVTPNHRPQFATVRPSIMEEANRIKSPRNNIVNCKLDEKKLVSQIEVLKEKQMETKEGIQDAKILIVAGQGFKRKEDLWMVEELAMLLNGQVASSRALVEKGWMPYERQIGLSGKTVKPEAIITCGVSGSVQFMTGMKTSKTIIAINIDSDSPIFSIAHQSIAGDIYEILPKLIHQLKEIDKLANNKN